MASTDFILTDYAFNYENTARILKNNKYFVQPVHVITLTDLELVYFTHKVWSKCRRIIKIIDKCNQFKRFIRFGTRSAKDLNIDFSAPAIAVLKELSRSYRIQEDIDEYFQRPTSDVRMTIIVQRWKNIIQEYRVFIVDAKIIRSTAIDNSHINESTLKLLDTIASSLLSVVNNRDFVCDIVLLDNGDLQILELNQNDACTDQYTEQIDL